MIKNFKKGSYKLSAATVAMCIMVSCVTLTNGAGSNVSADIKNITSSIEKSSNTVKFSLNSKHKVFYDIADLKNYVNFDFKLPSYIPQGYKLERIMLDETADNNQNIELSWFNKEHEFFTLTISKVNLLDEYKNSSTKKFDLSVKKEPMQVGSTSGRGVTLNYEYTDGMKSCARTFVWKNNVISYDIVYFNGAGLEGDTSAVVMLSNVDLNKIVTSLKNFKDVSYTSSYGDKKFSIYSERDMKKAEKMMGFVPKFSAKISDNYILSEADVDFDKNYGNVLSLSYNNNLKIAEIKGTSTFEKIIGKGYFSTVENGKTNKIYLNKLEINNTDIYRYKDTSFGARIVYFWKQAGVSYSAQITGNDENHKIIKSVLDSVK